MAREIGGRKVFWGILELVIAIFAWGTITAKSLKTRKNVIFGEFRVFSAAKTTLFTQKQVIIVSTTMMKLQVPHKLLVLKELFFFFFFFFFFCD